MTISVSWWNFSVEYISRLTALDTMSVFAPVSILGGLPVFAEVSFGKDSDTPNGPGDYWAEVDDIYWMKRDGSKGKPLPEHLFDKAMADDGADIIESVSDYLSHERWLREKAEEEAEERINLFLSNS